MDGSRMQEAQRVGRVQRIAPGKHAAWFYTLISEGTKEEEFGENRRTFMEEHGICQLRMSGYRYEFLDAEMYMQDESSEYITEDEAQRNILQSLADHVKEEQSKKDRERVLVLC